MQLHRHINIRLLRFVLVLVAVVILLSVTNFAGRFLIVNETPVKSDAIVVLGGGPMSRIVKGVQLYSEDYAPSLILSGGNLDMYNYTESKTMAMKAERMGVPNKRIILESKSTTTYQNAVFTKQILLAHKVKSAIIVSSDYHMRRVELVFNRVYEGTGIHLVYCAAPDRMFHPRSWWNDMHSVSIVISEYLKIMVTLIGFDRMIPV